MWPPQSVNTWPTPAPLSVRATSSPPVIQSEGAAPSEPPRLSSRQPPRFTDSPRPAGIRSQTRLGRRGLDHRLAGRGEDRKSTRLNSSHTVISYAVFCLKKKKKKKKNTNKKKIERRKVRRERIV